LDLDLDLDGNGGIQMDEVDAMIAENERDGAAPRGEEGRARENYDDGALHLANLEQRKAIWWKNVIVTGMFVLSW
jgi:hypothetical protein